MNLQVDFWQLLGLFFAGVGAFWGVLMAAATQTLARQVAAHAQLVERLVSIESSAREEAANWKRVEREILQLKAELPLNYVRREDYVQAIATIMAKLDAIGLRFENILLQRANKKDCDHE